MNEKVVIKSQRTATASCLLVVSAVVFVGAIIIYRFQVGEWGIFRHLFDPREPLNAISIFTAVALAIFGFLGVGAEIVVTDKRVYGKSTFGRQVDLPVDSISAVGSAWPSGVAVATSSGKISFVYLKNSKEIRECVTKLLLERQTKPAVTTSKPELPESEAVEIKRYKELLDMGAITQEEFEAKKKQLLDL